MGDSTYTDVHRGVPRLDNGIVWLKTSDDSKSSQRIFSRRCKFSSEKAARVLGLEWESFESCVADTVEEFCNEFQRSVTVLRLPEFVLQTRR